MKLTFKLQLGVWDARSRGLTGDIHHNRSIPEIINSEISEGYASVEKTR